MVINCLYDVAVKYGSVRSHVDLLNGNSHNVWGASFFSSPFFSPLLACWLAKAVCARVHSVRPRRRLVQNVCDRYSPCLLIFLARVFNVLVQP